MTPERARELTLTPPVDPRAVGTVGAFVVTYRRPELLVQTLRTIRLQTHAVQSVVVLNNDPAADVRTLLREEFPDVTVVDLPDNTGSAGGFAAALRLAAEQGLTWAWLFDDDVVPYPDALAHLLAATRGGEEPAEPLGVLAPTQVSAAAVFGASLWRHRPLQPPAALRNGTRPYPVDVASWAGMLVHRRTVEQVGYPRAEFFRCFADYEFCLRVRAAGLRVFAVPASRVRHEHGAPVVVTRFGRPSVRYQYSPARNYYHVRNAAYTARFILRSPAAMASHVLRTLRLAVGDLIYDDHRGRRLWRRLQGLVDGLRGRLGRREDLE